MDLHRIGKPAGATRKLILPEATNNWRIIIMIKTTRNYRQRKQLANSTTRKVENERIGFLGTAWMTGTCASESRLPINTTKSSTWPMTEIASFDPFPTSFIEILVTDMGKLEKMSAIFSHKMKKTLPHLWFLMMKMKMLLILNPTYQQWETMGNGVETLSLWLLLDCIGMYGVCDVSSEKHCFLFRHNFL